MSQRLKRVLDALCRLDYVGPEKLTFVYIFSIAIFTRKDHFKHSSEKYADFNIFHITCKCFSCPPSIVLCTNNVKKKRVTYFVIMFCTLELFLRNVTFMITQFICCLQISILFWENRNIC